MLTIHPRTAGRRSAFTLIEMMVVIAIIAILTTLIVAGVMMVMGKGPQVKTRSDLLNINGALQNFYAKYKFYPPSQLKLCSNYLQAQGGYQPANPLDAQSITALARMFPQLNSTNWVGINWGNRTGATAPVNGSPLHATTDILEGDQCLMFFLCGIPNNPATVFPNPPPALALNAALVPRLNTGAPLGFSTNPTNPVAAGGTRISFLNVDASRLYLFRANNPFPSYIDPWSTSPTTCSPYIYFSANNTKNGYDLMNDTSGALPVNTLFNVSPYIQSQAGGVTVYWNPDTFQLISAGLDTKFGTGGLCPPASATGKDDMSNFTDVLLGSL